VWCSFIFIVRRLPHINLFLKNTMEEGIVHIQLSKTPVL
jgi:hypothetical protein